MLAAGVLSRRELEARCTAEDIAMWRAFYKVEPWGCRVDDHRFGKVVQAIRKKGYPDEFLPGYHEHDIETSMHAAAEARKIEEVQHKIMKREQRKIDNEHHKQQQKAQGARK